MNLNKMNEYQISEWEQLIIQEEISTGDYPILKQLKGQERIEVEELKGGIKIKAKSWVGVIRFINFQIQIVPKLAGGNLGLVDMLSITTGIQALKRYRSHRFIEPQTNKNLIDLIALLYCDACEEILAGGLRYDYERMEDSLPTLRGRFLIDKQYQRRYGLLDRLECRYDEHSSNILDNKLLTYGLLQATKIVQNEVIKTKIRRLFTIFSESCQIDQLDIISARNDLFYDRLNSHYEDAHHLAWLIIDGLGIEDIFKSKFTPSFAFLLDMNTLFEKFVHVYLQYLLKDQGLFVNYQRNERSIIWDLFRQRSYSNIIPDYLITNIENDLKLPIDAKYKLYDEYKLDPGDVSQIFLYAYAYNQSIRPIGFLIYPTEKSSELKLSLMIRRLNQPDGARINMIGISIQSAIDEILTGSIEESGNAIINQICSQFSRASIT